MEKLISTVLVILAFSVVSRAEDAPQTGYTQPFEKKFDVRSVGEVRISYLTGGEPVSEPARVELWVRCKGSTQEKLVESLRICSLTKFVYEKDVKLLTLSYIYGRVVNAKAVCDAHDEREFKLGHFCDKAKHKAP
jgi:hypothetical protein